MTKHHGLSQLADTAREVTGGQAYYPVKRKGERRRLNPNWTGIAWLEAETLAATEIIQRTDLDGTDMAGMTSLTAAGKIQNQLNRTSHCRRMIDIFTLEASSSQPMTYHPCPDCDNFAYTATCTEHPELKWDEKQFVRPGTVGPNAWGSTDVSAWQAVAETIHRQTAAALEHQPPPVPQPFLADMVSGDFTPHHSQAWRDTVARLEDGTIRIRFDTEELPPLGSGMTYREWREQNGIG
jgi:hypothetical protein